MGFPRIRDFLKYMEEINPPIPLQRGFLIILDVVLRKEANVFHDPDLLEELVQEFALLCGVPIPSPISSSSSLSAAAAGEGEADPEVNAAKNGPPTKYIQINTGNAQDVPLESLGNPPNLDQSTTSTVLFNAYSYNVDTANSLAVFGESSASSQDFKTFEQAYLSKLPFGVTRRGPYLKFTSTGTRSSLEQPPSEGPSSAAAEEGVTGGLRRVRPLYRNARTTAAQLVDGSSNDEGLRKRTGARTHRRVRKSSRVTRRR
jgi:hypothetical protein